MTTPLQQYLELELHYMVWQLETKGQNGPEVDAKLDDFLDRLDPLWYALTEEDKALLRKRGRWVSPKEMLVLLGHVKYKLAIDTYTGSDDSGQKKGLTQGTPVQVSQEEQNGNLEK